MKPLLYSLLLICLFSCKKDASTKEQNIKPKTEVSSSNNFNWLVGDWKRLNETEGKQTFESWKQKSNNHYEGIGYTLKDNDTIWIENLSLKNISNTWMLKVVDPKEKDSVNFKIVNIKTNEFTAENKKHDFPTHITYWTDNKLLKAKVSNKEFNIDFDFEKLKNE